MRYIQIPSAVNVTNMTGDVVLFTFAAMLEEVVWIHQVWRRDAAHLKMLFALTKKFGGAMVGEWVELTDKEYEAFMPVATMQGEKLAPKNAIAMMRLMSAVVEATEQKPEQFDEQRPQSQPNAN